MPINEAVHEGDDSNATPSAVLACIARVFVFLAKFSSTCPCIVLSILRPMIQRHISRYAGGELRAARKFRIERATTLKPSEKHEAKIERGQI